MAKRGSIVDNMRISKAGETKAPRERTVQGASGAPGWRRASRVGGRFALDGVSHHWGPSV